MGTTWVQHCLQPTKSTRIIPLYISYTSQGDQSRVSAADKATPLMDRCSSLPSTHNSSAWTDSPSLSRLSTFCIFSFMSYEAYPLDDEESNGNASSFSSTTCISDGPSLNMEHMSAPVAFSKTSLPASANIVNAVSVWNVITCLFFFKYFPAFFYFPLCLFL